mgnify:CR=1 FL=1
MPTSPSRLLRVFLPFTSNNGKFQNQGFEFELAFKVIDSKDWKWNLNWNGALNKNKVVALPDNGLERNRQNAFQVYTGRQLEDGSYEKAWVGGYQEGQRPGDLYMFVAEGIYRSEDEIPGGLIDLSSGNNGSSNRPLYGGEEGYNKLTANQKANSLRIQPGDVKWKDVNGDGIIDNYDMVKVGNNCTQMDRRYQYFSHLERPYFISTFLTMRLVSKR